ncbi:MAG: ABC transporter substrate-binding protein [Parasporobacterium sp.]|nr:ABC transporter substrate-binding protein [Parasporobacterium sp.]
MKKFIACALAAVMSVAMMAGVSMAGEAEAVDRTLNIAWAGDIETYDAHMTTQDYCVPVNVFDRLFEIVIGETGSAELVNSLVADYSVSEDGMTFDFTLRDDVVFSNGEALTADDVAYTFTRMVAVEGSQQEYLFETVVGYEEFTGTGNYHDAYLPGITVTDATHFSIQLSTPYAGFLNILGSPACCIYSKAVVEEAGEAFGQDPAFCIGSGAYVVSSWTRDLGMELGYNSLYWGTAPDFNNVKIQIIPDADTLNMMFQSGQIDILDGNYLDSAIIASVYKTMYADKIVYSSRLGTSYMALNQASNEALADVNVRRAIAMSIDRQLIIDTIINGDGMLVDGIFPQGLVGFSEENQGWLQYDPEGAQALLESAGYTKGDDGYYFSFTIENDENNSSTRQSVIMAIADMLQKNGINATVKNNDHSSWLDMRKAGEIDSYVSTWTADYNDPDNFIATFWGSEARATGRSLGYTDQDVMTRVSAAPAIIDDAERQAEYAALEKKIVEEDVSWVPVYQEIHIFVMSQNVSEFIPHWAGYSDFSFSGVKAAN